MRLPRLSPRACVAQCVVSGTIRGDYALAVGRNICHGSDSVENAEKEIKLYVVLLLFGSHSIFFVGGSPRELSSTSLPKQT